jgi:mannose-6-phosphate isomerase-like protein (cupin superfamily)
MSISNNFYSNKLVKKPWGYEYVIYNSLNRVAITYVHIDSKKSTSLHCHPKKKTGFIIVKGTALVQIGIYKKNKKKFKSLSRLVVRPGLFHSLKAVSKNGMSALEFETPYNKADLVRFEDRYGRKNKDYEGSKFTSLIKADLLKFKKPKKNKKNVYKLDDVEITLERTKNFKNLSTKDSNSSTAILEGKIFDKKNQEVISYGEIVKSSTLKILSKKYIVKKPLLILNVTRKK